MENVKTEGIFVEKVIGFVTKKVHSSGIVLVLNCSDDNSDSPEHILIVIAWLIRVDTGGLFKCHPFGSCSE